ncbi:17517_t:CDS:2, partial [Cetraspora pellucida]
KKQVIIKEGFEFNEILLSFKNCETNNAFFCARSFKFNNIVSGSSFEGLRLQCFTVSSFWYLNSGPGLSSYVFKKFLSSATDGFWFPNSGSKFHNYVSKKFLGSATGGFGFSCFGPKFFSYVFTRFFGFATDSFWFSSSGLRLPSFTDSKLKDFSDNFVYLELPSSDFRLNDTLVDFVHLELPKLSNMNSEFIFTSYSSESFKSDKLSFRTINNQDNHIINHSSTKNNINKKHQFGTTMSIAKTSVQIALAEEEAYSIQNKNSNIDNILNNQLPLVKLNFNSNYNLIKVSNPKSHKPKGYFFKVIKVIY